MKALVKSRPTPGLWLEDVPLPAIGDQDVLIKIKKTSICGTDLHIYNWNAWAKKTVPVPMWIGHEYVGEIVKMGSLVKGYQMGQRVSGEGHIVCGHCRNCRAGQSHLCRNTIGVGVNRPGAFAEYLALPASNVFPLPPVSEISDEEATLLDPLGNAVHTALSFNLVGEDVLVTGAGPLGIMGAVVARRVGARNIVVTDVNDYRLNLARSLGVLHTLNVSTHPGDASLMKLMSHLGMMEGFDVGFEMSGNPNALSNMVHNMRTGGRIALLGIPPQETQIAWDQIIFKGLFLKGIYGRELFETWYKMIALLQGGMNIKPLITHHLGARDFKEAFEVVSSGQSGKVILDWEHWS